MPFAEGQGVDHPLQFYAATKRANELMAHAYAHLYRPALHRPALLHRLRPLGPAGHGADALRRRDPRGPADPGSSTHGRHSRDFTYVDDIVEGVIRASDRDRRRPIPTGIRRDPDPGHLGRALPPLQHRQQRPGRARRLHRRARGGARAARRSASSCRCSPATCPTPAPTRRGWPAP